MINLIINVNVPKTLNTTHLRQVLFAFAMQLFKGGEFHEVVQDLLERVFVADFKPKPQENPFQRDKVFVTKTPLRLWLYL